MTKDEIRTVCPEEGGKVFFQLQAVKSAIAVSHMTLANALDTRATAHQTVTFLPLPPNSSPLNSQACTTAATDEPAPFFSSSSGTILSLHRRQLLSALNESIILYV